MVKSLEEDLVRRIIYNKAKNVITRGYFALNNLKRNFDPDVDFTSYVGERHHCPNSNTFLKESLTEDEIEVENMINNDVTEEIISLYENEISKTSEYKPNEIMVKLTARILDKYYPKDKPRSQVLIIKVCILFVRIVGHYYTEGMPIYSAFMKPAMDGFIFNLIFNYIFIFLIMFCVITYSGFSLQLN